MAQLLLISLLTCNAFSSNNVFSVIKPRVSSTSINLISLPYHNNLLVITMCDNPSPPSYTTNSIIRQDKTHIQTFKIHPRIHHKFYIHPLLFKSGNSPQESSYRVNMRRMTRLIIKGLSLAC